MTPAEHYAEAERLIGLAANLPAGSDPGQLVAAAQVHATLATVDPDALWPLRPVDVPEAEASTPVEPHARQRAAAGWDACEACDHPADRHDLTSDSPPPGGWEEPVEPCEVDGCGCVSYVGTERS